MLRVTALAACTLLTGCAIAPPPPRACPIDRYLLAVEGVATGPATLRGQVEAAGGDRRAPMLFMSGGGQYGAFGAGLLDGWAANSPGGRLPEFRVVTGVSTGAILATYAFTGETAAAVAGYTLTREDDVLTPLVRWDTAKGEPTTRGYLDLLRRGALGDLAPLRTKLRTAITPAMLEAVAAGGARGRRLYVGAVDVDHGRAEAFDLTALAARFAAAAGPERDRLHDCYVEAVMASSSAPLAALPVFINNRMYVDGGVRFGMFTDELGPRLPDAGLPLESAPRPEIFLIINGDQQIAPRCAKADPAKCVPADDSAAAADGPHAPWKFPDLALRSQKILTNQIYRFSADAVRDRAAQDFAFHAAQIEPEAERFQLEGRKCSDWRAIDGRTIQFQPNYMRCLIAYGRSEATRLGWHRLPG